MFESLSFFLKPATLLEKKLRTFGKYQNTLENIKIEPSYSKFCAITISNDQKSMVTDIFFSQIWRRFPRTTARFKSYPRVWFNFTITYKKQWNWYKHQSLLKNILKNLIKRTNRLSYWSIKSSQTSALALGPRKLFSWPSIPHINFTQKQSSNNFRAFFKQMW